MTRFANESGDGMTSPLAAAETVGAAATSLGDADAGNVTVFFDGACPLCAAEIGYYQGRKGAETVTWVDVSACGAVEVMPGLKREDALRRFHVRAASGQVISGGRAFAVLWSALPGFRWLGQGFRSGLPARLLDWLYDRFLRWRPHFQALARRRTSSGRRGR